MISPANIYIVATMDNVKQLLGISTTIAVFVCCTTLLVYGISRVEDCAITAFGNMMKFIKVLIIAIVIMASVNAFIPNSKTLAAMYLIPAVVNNEKMQNIGSNSLEILEKLTQEWLNDIKGKSKTTNPGPSGNV